MLMAHFQYGSTISYTCCTEQQLTRYIKTKQIYTNYFYVRCTEVTNVRQRLELNTLNFIQKRKNGEVTN